MDIKALAGNLYAAKGWMKLVGVMLIITGVFQALTIVGILWCWLFIWQGVLLFQSAGAIEQAYMSENADFFAMSLAKLKTYFTIMGVLMLIMIIAIIAVFLLGGFAAIMGGMAGY